jgi:hypothetical protein
VREITDSRNRGQDVKPIVAEQPAVPNYGFASSAWDREIPGAGHTKKIIGKPSGGKLHGLFKKGFLERAGE